MIQIPEQLSQLSRQKAMIVNIPLIRKYNGNGLTPSQNDPNGMFLDAQGIYHLYYQCE